jgi:hypothetical protein
MPADALVDDVGTGRLHGARLGNDLLGRQAALHEVDRGNAEHDEKVAADAPAHRAHDLRGQPQPVLEAPAPGIAAVVGAGRRELVDEVAFAAHDLDAVIAGLARQCGSGGVIGDGAEDVGLAHAPGGVGIDRRGDGRGAYGAIDLGVAARVQDLQRDASAGRAHGVGDVPMLRDLPGAVEDGRIGLHQPFLVGRETARDDQAGAAPGTLDIEAGDALERPVQGLEPRVHGAHDDAVRESHEPEVERPEQVGIGGHACEATGWGRVA